MKLFILSDIHGDYDSCLKALESFAEFQADYLILLGDILYHGPRNPLPASYAPDKVYPLLNKYADKIIAVRGNCDSEVDQMVLDFNISDDYTFLSLRDRLVYLSHGHIYDPDNLPTGIQTDDVFLFGHIHTPIAEKRDKYYIGNPGSCTFPKEDYPPSFGLLDDESFTIYSLSGGIVKQVKW